MYQVPSQTKATGDNYKFTGATYWQSYSDTIDIEKTSRGIWNDTWYARLTDAPIPAGTSLLDVWVFPKTIGERGAHRFHFTYKPSDEADAVSIGQKIWIRFDAEYYDYYLGAAYQPFRGAKDSEGEPKYIIDCMVSIGGGTPIVGTEC